MIRLGMKVRDRLSGFTGVAVARVEFLYGCTRIGIEPEELFEGKPLENPWYFDEQRVEVLDNGNFLEVAPAVADPGGYMTPPKRHPDPR